MDDTDRPKLFGRSVPCCHLGGVAGFLGGRADGFGFGTVEHGLDDEGQELDPGLVVGDCPGVADEVFHGGEEGGAELLIMDFRDSVATVFFA